MYLVIFINYVIIKGSFYFMIGKLKYFYKSSDVIDDEEEKCINYGSECYYIIVIWKVCNVVVGFL